MNLLAVSVAMLLPLNMHVPGRLMNPLLVPLRMPVRRRMRGPGP